ncbi:MAG: L-asparaginase, partial [Anaerosporomusa subterranea]|nr:L-asparaginase [Anaerosporomusa subterranea]
TRHVESVHTGYVCIVDSSNNLLASIGDSSQKIFLRSSAKPFQAVAAVSSGATGHYGITSEELAVMCASHSGEEIHRKTVQSILTKVGLAESNLECGAANPYNQETNEWLIRHREKPTSLYNCCSGKHAGMLLLCKFFGYPTENYIAPDHPVQRHIFQTMAELLGCSAEDIILGEDGCGVPNCLITLRQAAYLYALLAGPGHSHEYKQALAKIKEAILANPLMISGTGEFCTELMQNSDGKVVGKVGGEGVYGLGIVGTDKGICIKIADGNERAVYPVVVRVLRQLGVFDQAAEDRLYKWAYPPVNNHHGKMVGHTLPVFDIYNSLRNFSLASGDEYDLEGENDETSGSCHT